MRKKIIKAYLLPVIILLIFISSIVFIIIPKINLVVNSVYKINDLVLELESKKEDLKKLVLLDSNLEEIKQQRDFVNQIAPESTTEVVKFRNSLTEIALNSGLEITKQEFSENIYSEENTKSENLSLREIPSKFQFTGSFDNVRKFVSELNYIKDFVIIDNMSLVGGGYDEWTFNMSIVKYQFNEIDIEKVKNLYLSIKPSSEFNLVVKDYIEKKYE